ncbi:hypothetical protein EU96_2000 [Prochlorococcus marinus str. MIT 9302]|uniref:Putative gluconeogenesis factor n=1 Tax=Prochlorococcus marinus str. MIT 9302 TaxID=74545 RepID=A0A0A2A5Z8_PROMR|nr:gluconeogenesis factor YvcK family protein [Prochlorococcus marinus]KGF96256.1 hypothetical protein EU96_2000 [Prochlorococcus marinus str. MIT 9302]
MNKRKKRIRRYYKNFKKSNFNFLNKIIRILSWLLPGLVIKRWLITSAIGFLTTLLGLVIWTNLRPLYWLIEIFFGLMTGLTSFLPVSILGPLIVVIGLLLIGIGQNRSINSIQKALVPEKNTFLVDALRFKSKLNRGPNIVAIGGGTGLSTLLKGLKNYSTNITAIVTVSDDGGSSGILRKQLGVQPPGDIRNCLAALSNEEPTLTRLFQYRFSGGSDLEGHSFGNLFLSALTRITGSLEKAVQASSKVLAVQGQVLPATNTDVMLWAELEDGKKIFGESKIGKSKKLISKIGILPENPSALPSALESIKDADLIILGPGSLYTSLLPNLLVPEIVDALLQSDSPKIYISNLMTQPGETDGLNVYQHIKSIEKQLSNFGVNTRIFNAILSQAEFEKSPLVDFYESRGAEPVQCNKGKLISEGYYVLKAPLYSKRITPTLRHDPRRLARAVIFMYRKLKKLN